MENGQWTSVDTKAKHPTRAGRRPEESGYETESRTSSKAALAGRRARLGVKGRMAKRGKGFPRA